MAILVLSRHKDEKTVIIAGGKRIEATIIDIRGDKVRIGWEADPDVTINRKEVQDRIDAGETKAT